MARTEIASVGRRRLRTRLTVGLFVGVFCLSVERSLADDDGAVATIAETLLGFVHTVTPSQRRDLEQIVEDPHATSAQRTIAGALMRVLHTPDPRDIAALHEIAEDPAEPTAIRQLASIVAGIVHIPSEMDRAVLMQLLCEQS